MKNGVFKFDYAEPPPIFYKGSERREQGQMKNGVFKFDYAELPPIFYKDSERREQGQMKTLFLGFTMSNCLSSSTKQAVRLLSSTKIMQYVD